MPDTFSPSVFSDDVFSMGEQDTTPVFSSLVFSHDSYLGLQVFSMLGEEGQPYAAFSTPQLDGQTIVKLIDY